MQLDAKNRRSRFARPQPQRTAIELTERDFKIFEALDRHTQLPINYIFDFIKADYRNYGELQRRLTDLYNGYCDHPDHGTENKDGHVCLPQTYVARHPAQFANREAHHQPIIYSLTPLSKKIINQSGRGEIYSPKRNDHFVHQFFDGCFSASIELLAEQHSLRYISREEILQSHRMPEATRALKNPFSVPTLLPDLPHIVPDNLFGLEYAPGRARFFAVEVDRNTETIRPNVPVKNSIAKKVRGYDSILKNMTYIGHFGIGNLTVLFATTNFAHMLHMLEYVRSSSTKPDKYLFKAFADFGENWRVPRELLPVFDPWESVAGAVTLDATKKAPA